MAADYTRTIVFKVEDQAIKRATGQIVASLKRIEKSLEKIEEKAFKQLVTDSGKVAENIDKAATALNKYNEELRKAQTQGKLSPFKSALAVREPGGALARTGGGAKRGGRGGWASVGLGLGNVLGVGITGVTASTLAINSLTKQYNNFAATLRSVPVVGDAIANTFNVVEHKVNGLEISLHSLRQLWDSHPLFAIGTTALLFGVGANVKNVTTAVWGLKDALGATGRGMSNLLKTARNTSKGIKETLVGTFAGVSGSYGGPLNKGFVSGKGYSLGLGQFLKPAKSATVDVFDIGKRSPYSKYDASRPASFRDLPYIDREAVEAKRFTDAALARGLDPKQKEGLAERIERNIESSRMSRTGSGFSNWSRDTSGYKRANKFLTDRQKILRAIAKQNAKLKKQGLEEISVADALNKKMRERLGITEQQGEWSYDERRRNMFTRDARFNRRERATQRLNRRKQGRFAQRTGMNPKQAENLMLGFGFPMLFGGGIGAVGGGLGGAALGNAIGMPGFGLQIMMSAVGTQLENLVMKAHELGKALEELDMTALEASGVKVSANLAEQVNDLRRIGDATRARYLLEVEAFKQTGAWPSANRNIKRTVDDLGNSWNRVSTTIGTALGTLSGPFLDTLGTILDVVNEIVKSVNFILTLPDGISDGIFKLLGLEEKVAKAKYEQSQEGKQALSDAKDKLSITIDQLAAEKKIRDIENSKSLGNTYADKIGNIGKDYEAAVAKIRSEQSKAKKDLLKNAKLGYRLSGAYDTDIMRIDAEAGGKIAAAENKRDRAIKQVDYDRDKLVEQLRKEFEEQKLITEANTQDLGKQLELEKDRLTLTRGQVGIRSKEIEIARKKLEITWAQDKLDKLREKSLKESLTEEEQIQENNLGLKIANLNAQNALNEAQLENARILADPMQAAVIGLQQELNKLNDVGYQVVQAATAIGSAFGESFRGIVSGSMTAQEALRNLFQRTADHFADMAARMIANQIAMKVVGIGLNLFAGSDVRGAATDAGRSVSDMRQIMNGGLETVIDGYANGGRPPKGRVSLVGERGPELFVPDSAGTVIPSHAMGGTNVVVNVDASGSSVEGDGGQAEELGSMLAAAVQAEIANQQRPGGLLAGTR